MFPKVSRLTLDGWPDMCANNVFGAAWHYLAEIGTVGPTYAYVHYDSHMLF